jgi:hypothetical protein
MDSCALCQEAIELDRTWVITLDGAEVAVLACPEHLYRLLLALELVEACETSLEMTLPPLLERIAQLRIVVAPSVLS